MKKEINIQKIDQKFKKNLKHIEKEIKQEFDGSVNHNKEPKYIRILKIIVILIAVCIIIFILANNFLISKDFHYFYDLGDETDFRSSYLTPTGRISDVFVEGDITYRNLISDLVYFNVNIPLGSSDIFTAIRFKENFSENYELNLGAKDQENWHYTYNKIYSPELSNLIKFNNIDNVYLINPSLNPLTLEELRYERNVVVASDKLYTPLPNIISNYQPKETIINTSLRGGHSFYIYASGDLKVDIKKQEINWYDGSDPLNISLYDLNDFLITNTIIEDDGIVEIKNKELGIIQEGILTAKNLSEGVYKLEFSDFDGLIREIKINTNKIVVAEPVFLADNLLYNVETKTSNLYFESLRKGQIKLITWHNEGIQNVKYKENGIEKDFNLYQEDAPLYFDLIKGDYEIIFPKNDITISGQPYFSFSRENYFEPFKQNVIKIQNDINWIKNNVDYLISDYKTPIKDNNWLIAETKFNIKRDNLFVEDNKLSMVFKIIPLQEKEDQNFILPIDWIKITVHKPGLFEEWGLIK